MIIRMLEAGDLRVTQTSQRDTLTPTTQRRAATAWEEARRGRPWLADGWIFSVVELTDREILGTFVPYRWFAAQEVDPTLREHLKVEPLAVTGRTFTTDGAVLLARRSSEVTQNPGAWELAPAGGVDTSAVAPDGTIDLESALAIELVEELGVHCNQVSRQLPRAVVYDPSKSIYDVLFDVHLNIDRKSTLEAFQRRPSKEYQTLTFVELDVLGSIISPRSRVLDPGVLQLLNLPVDVE